MKKAIILLGPTGAGKTAASILLARALNAEIISADSMQIYRHMDIGTAKPSREEMQAVRHHMIDIVDPWETYSAGEYIKNVRLIMDGLLSQGKVPLIVGGTGLYIKAMTRGIFTGPSADWDLRNELLNKEREKPGFLFNYLQSLDSQAAGKIKPADTRRLIRALEVCIKSNHTISVLHQALTKPLPYEFIKIGLTRCREELYRMIDERVDRMIASGLVKEVKQVMDLINKHYSSPQNASFSAKQDLKFKIQNSITNSSLVTRYPSLSSMQAIGYKEIAAHLSGESSLADTVALIKKRSRNYAKRQFTWFRKEEGIHWIDVTGMPDANEIFKKVVKLING